MYGVPRSHISLEEYWDYLQINECAGYGIRNFPTTGQLGMGCGDYWDQKFRYFLVAAMSKAEHRTEADRWLGFPLRRTYISQRQFEYVHHLTVGKYTRGVGVQTQALVDSPTLTLRTAGVINDPVVFTVTVDFTDVDELIIKYPSAYFDSSCEDFLIRPSCVAISGTTATVTIPRCRLLLPEHFLDYSDDTDRPDYEVDANFLSVVDVYRDYLNTTTGVNLVWYRTQAQVAGCCTFCGSDICLGGCEPSGACAETKQLACPYVVDQRLGIVQLEPATYAAATGWTKSSYTVCRKPDNVELSYMRGRYDRYDALDEDITKAIIAIAHNNMPEQYCNCSVQTLYFKRDNKPIEPPVRLGLGMSTWGLYEAEQVIREFDSKSYGYHGGML